MAKWELSHYIWVALVWWCKHFRVLYIPSCLHLCNFFFWKDLESQGEKSLLQTSECGTVIILQPPVVEYEYIFYGICYTTNYIKIFVLQMEDRHMRWKHHRTLESFINSQEAVQGSWWAATESQFSKKQESEWIVLESSLVSHFEFNRTKLY